jgi:tRNA dimethylallyltransferase
LDALASIEVITGPTASGKTALAFQRALQDPGIEIVNADAFQLYRGFDIGTAKPSLSERNQVRHHLIDILEPHEPYSAGQYAPDARAAVEDIIARAKKPLVVGGSGLYINALFFGIASYDIEEGVKEAAIKRYREELSQSSFEALHEQLRDIDPDLYIQISRERNPLRLERAWVHYYATGVPLGVARKSREDVFKYQPAFTVLMPERQTLHERIARRIEHMLELGWADEVRNLLAQGVTVDMPAMRAIGYVELANVLHNKLSLKEARESIIQQTRQYAKRQITWMQRYHRQAK